VGIFSLKNDKHDMLIIFLGRLGQILLTFLTVKLATTFLSPSGYGQMSLILAVIAGFNSVLINPVGMFVNRRLHGWVDAGTVKKYFINYAGYLLLVILIATIVIIVLQNTIGLVVGVLTSWLVVIIGISLLFNTANQTFIPSLNLLNFRIWFVVLSLITLLASLLLSLFFAYIFQANAEYWLFGQVLGQAFLGVVSGVIFFRVIKTVKVKEPIAQLKSQKQWSAMFLFIWPLAVAVGLHWVQTQSYRFIVGKTLGLSSLGLFVVGYGVSASIIASYESVLTTYFLPLFYRRVSLDDRSIQSRAWLRYASAVFPTLFLTAFFIICFSQDICKILLGPNFQLAYHYVIYGALAESGRVIVATYSYIAHARMKTYKLLPANITGAIIAPTLIFLLTPHFGIKGAGIALVIASASLVLVLRITLNKQLNISFPWKEMFKAIIFCLILCSLFLIANVLFKPAVNIWEAMLWVGAFGFVYLFFVYKLLSELLQEKYDAFI